jgi:hypothetical protein
LLLNHKRTSLGDSLLDMGETKPVPPVCHPSRAMFTAELHAAFLASHGGERAYQPKGGLTLQRT